MRARFVICANGTLRFSQHGEKYVMVGKGDEWEHVPFDDPPAEMTNEWKAFAEASRGARACFGQVHQLVGRHRQSLRELVIAHPADHEQQLVLFQ